MMEQTDTGIILCGRNTDLVDRISILHDSILGVILSFLSIKQAVATALLSKRWTFLWRTVPNLVFYQDLCCEEEDLCCEEDDRKFIEFVNRVLHLHDSGFLDKFILSWECNHVSSHINSWINTVITKNVHSLSLSGNDPFDPFDLPESVFRCQFDLPESVFRCDSLRSLNIIDTVVCVSDTLDVCLPRLESLTLDKVRFKNEESCEKLISRCPVLKNLHLYIANDDLIDFKCRISSTSLRHLEIFFYQKSSLKLNAASLEYLNLDGCIREIIIESSLSSLVEAYLGFELFFEDEDELVESYNSIVEAIHAFGCAKVLTLVSCIDKAFERATISRSFEFKRLVKLESTYTRSLQDMIRSSDNLEVLKIFKFVKQPSKWLTFTEVPRCFSNSLKKVHLYFDTCGEDDLEIIRLILEHGSRLEVVEICCYGKIKDDCTDVVLLRERVELTQKILEFPRKSPACRVRITPYGQ